MRKTQFLTLAALAFVAAACSNDDTVSISDSAKQTAIGFSPYVDNAVQTRATNDVLNTNIKDFAVYGFNQQNSTMKKIFNGDKVYLPGSDEGVSGNTDKWTYDATQYWESDVPYWFCALAPYGNGATIAFPTPSSEDTPTYKSFGNITFTNTTGTTDLCYAFNGGSDGAGISYTLSTGSTEARVPFTFQHLLSRVRVEFTNADNSLSVLKITGLKLTGAYTDASTCSMGGDDGKTATWTGQGSGEIAYPETYYIPGVTDGTATEVYQTWQGSENNWTAEADPLEIVRYLIPGQGTTEASLTIEFTAQILSKNTTDNTEGSNRYTGGSKTFTATISDINGGMAQGTAYVLKATIKPEDVYEIDTDHPIQFTVEKVEDWGNETEEPITPTAKS